MKCIKCQSDVPDGKYCNQCGALQERKAGRRMRPNGSGTAYKRGKTWTASVTIAWEQGNVEGKLKPVKRTKGGFKTKRDALEYCQVLKSHVAAPKRITIKELYDMYQIIYKDTGIEVNHLVASGNGLRKNQVLQEISSEMFGAELSLAIYQEEAACGAAVSSAMGVV